MRVRGLKIQQNKKTMKSDKRLHSCPTCRSRNIRLVRGKYSTRIRGEPVTVPDLEREECPDCGEILFGPEAMRRLEGMRELSAKAR